MSTADLLRKAADALEAGQDPFALPFLQEHDVTLDQCQSLADQMAIGARVVAAGIEKPRSLAGQAMLTAMVEAL
jgi:hypothetical protein